MGDFLNSLTGDQKTKLVIEAAKVVPAIIGFNQANKAKNQQAEYLKDIKTAEKNRQRLVNPYAQLSNPYQNMQVATKAAEMQAEQTDLALANTLDSLRKTGAGGATALAAQAAKSKAGIAADIDKQVKENEVRRAQGEMQLQREQLAQQNLASQFDLGQQQFNVAAVNTARQFSANAANQAAAFEAGALNNAERFNAQAANQFALQNFQTEAQMNQFNTNALNQFARAEYGAMNQLNLANAQAANRADEFAAKTSFNADQLARQGDMSVQQFQYNRLAAMMGQRQAEAAQATAANERQRGMLLEGLSQAASGAGSAIASRLPMKGE